MPTADNQSWTEEVYTILRIKAYRRWTRVLVYFFLTASAVASAVVPSNTVESQSDGGLIGDLWTLTFGIAAIVCFVGSLIDRWYFEYMGLPMLYSSILVLAIILTVQIPSSPAGWQLLPFALLFYAFSFSLLARWRDVQALVKASRELREGEE